MARCWLEGQSNPRSPDEVSEEEINGFRLIKMAYCTARLVLFDIFKWGTMQQSGQTVEDYLLNTIGYTSDDYKRSFYKQQRRMMSDKSKESHFDVTLLVKLIPLVCIKVTGSDANQLKGSLGNIREFRNNQSHNWGEITKSELISQAGKLMKELEKALTVAGTLFNQDTSEVQNRISEMKDDIENIKLKPMVPSDLSQCHQYCELLQKVLKHKGCEELKLRYKNSTQVNPVSFLAGKSVRLDIGTVFTKIEVESAGMNGSAGTMLAKGTLVPCEDIIEFCHNSGSTSGPEVHLIEGPAGSGKTTLLKHIKGQWTSPTCSIKQLDKFDLLLVMDCRNHSLSSFSKLLSQLLPITSAKYFKDGHLQKFVLGMKTLLLVDGLDELNSSSEKLFLEILELKAENLVVLCTSRPEKVPYFQLHVATEFQTAHLKISGIADDKREEFVVKYHSEMQKVGLSGQDTDKLLQYMRKKQRHLQSHFRLPLNLVFLVWLWAGDPSVMNAVTTCSELYLQTLKLMKNKLIERLMHNETTVGVDLDELKEKVEMFVTCMCQQALISLRWDMIEKFHPDSVTQMKAVCKANMLPPKEVMSAFLVINTAEGKEVVSFPHKLMQEFYASLWIQQTLFDENRKANNSALMKDLTEVLKRHQVSSITTMNIISEALKPNRTISSQKPGAIRDILTDLHKEDPQSLKLPKYHSLLIQVAGVLYAHGSKNVEGCTAVDIVQLLKEAKFVDNFGPHFDNNNKWYDLIDNVMNDNTILKEVSSQIKGGLLTITEDHIEAALVLLDVASLDDITVEIVSKSDSILSHFEPLIEKISKCSSHSRLSHSIQHIEKVTKCSSSLSLYFCHDFVNPDPTPANDEQLKFLAMRCELVGFAGHVSGEALLSLPDHPIDLHLALSNDEQAAGVMKYLQQQEQQQMFIRRGQEYIHRQILHITPAVSPSSLCQLPSVLGLYLSDVNDAGIIRVCEIAATMFPHQSECYILFPRAQVTEEGWKQLLTGLKENKCGIRFIYVSEEIGLTDDKLQTLQYMAKLLLGCDFYRWPEDEMWRRFI